jgi:hypothetical protein
MPEGEYTIEVTSKNGRVERKSRIQNNATGEAAITTYLKNKQRVLESYKPLGKKAGQPLAGVVYTMKLI